MRHWLLVLLWGTSGCDVTRLVDDQREALFDPAAGYVAEGVRVVEGDFHDLWVTYNTEGPVRFLARTTEDDGEHLHVLAIDWGRALQSESKKPDVIRCDAGLVTDVQFLWDPARVDVEEFFQVRRDEDGDGYGSIRFLDYSCREFARLDDVHFDSYVTFNDASIGARRDFARTRGGDFYEIFYDGRPPELLFSSISWIEFRPPVDGSPAFWLVEDGELIRFDLTRNEVTVRVGRGVHDLRWAPEGGILFSDDDGIQVQNVTGEPVLVSETGCSPFAARIDAQDVVFFFDPCDEHQLNLVSLSAPERVHVRGGVVEGEIQFLEFESSFAQVSPKPLGLLLGTTSGTPSTPKHRAYAGTVSWTPGEESLETEWLEDDVSFVGARLYRNHDGTSGDYIVVDDDDFRSLPRTPSVLENVVAVPFAQQDYQIFAADFDGSRASLYSVLYNQAEPLGVDVLVPPQSPAGIFHRSSVISPDVPSRYAFVTPGKPDSKGRATTELRTWHIPQHERPVISEPLARNVRPGSPRPLDHLNGIIYRTNDTRRTLRVYLDDSDLDQPIADHVSEVIEIDAPSTGLAYVVDAGEERGIWFAKFR